MANQSIYTVHPILKTIPPEKLPHNIFIIPDGNGRWAKQHHVPVSTGHTQGYTVIQTLLEDLSQLSELQAIGFWGFAVDNWKRSEEEVKSLMHIFSFVLAKHIHSIKKRNGVFIHLGRKDRLPRKLHDQIERAEKETEKNTGQIVYLALDFGGEDQQLRLLERMKSLPADIVLDQNLLWDLRDAHGRIKSADLLIRTSGEIRTSDVGWLNGAPTELYFINKLFPDITTSDIVDAIVAFSNRERRLGGRK